jgi:hypothetical protein
MVLSTFGAIMAFSFEMVQYALDTYKTAVKNSKNPILRETLEALLQEAKKNLVLMEQIRRENITEMILEPIYGLQREDYEMDIPVFDQAQDVDLIKMALTLEKQMQNFFSDASVKISIPEVERIFRKIVQKKKINLAKLEGLGLGE